MVSHLMVELVIATNVLVMRATRLCRKCLQMSMLLSYSLNLGIELNTIVGGWSTNLKVRKEEIGKINDQFEFLKV